MAHGVPGPGGPPPLPPGGFDWTAWNADPTVVAGLAVLGAAYAAAALYRHCRARGETVGQLTDCLIAVVAMRHKASLLHRDHDFEVIARHTPLQVAS